MNKHNGRRHNHGKYIDILYCIVVLIIGLLIAIIYWASVTHHNTNSVDTQRETTVESSVSAKSYWVDKDDIVYYTVDDVVYVGIPSRYNDFSNLIYTDEEINMLATLVYLEAGIESFDCQEAVASVVLNRMYIYDKSLEEIIYEKGQFTPADKIQYSTPSESSLSAVKNVLSGGTTLPTYVTFFRGNHYHNWDASRYVPYCNIDNTYFTYDKQLKEKYE